MLVLWHFSSFHDGAHFEIRPFLLLQSVLVKGVELVLNFGLYIRAH